jgi:protease-4
VVAIKRALLHEIVPRRQFSSMEAFYEMLMSSGQLHILAVMPSEVIVN